jgi:hypothetical protein
VARTYIFDAGTAAGKTPKMTEAREMKRRHDHARLDEPLKGRKEQKPCDVGLFSDDAKGLTIPADLSIPEFLRRAT